MVAGWHAFGVLQPQGWHVAVYDTARVLFNGHAAVTLFFVLSGLVLGLSFNRADTPLGTRYAHFALRRVFRICPAFWVAVLLIAGAVVWLDAPREYPAGVSAWFAGHWREPVTGPLVLRNLLFLDRQLNPPSWTLRAELVCSFVLPLLALISSRASRRGQILALLALMTTSALGSGNLNKWLIMFYLGVWIPTAGRWFFQRLQAVPGVARWTAPVAWLALLTGQSWYGPHPAWGDLIEGATAATFISAVLYGPGLRWFRVLDWPLARFYGRVSYSFYLYNMVSLYFVAKLAMRLCPVSRMVDHAVVSAAGLLLVSVLLTTLLAALSYRLVERPSIGSSKRLCALLTPNRSRPWWRKFCPRSKSAPQPAVSGGCKCD